MTVGTALHCSYHIVFVSLRNVANSLNCRHQLKRSPGEDEPLEPEVELNDTPLPPDFFNISSSFKSQDSQETLDPEGSQVNTNIMTYF